MKTNNFINKMVNNIMKKKDGLILVVSINDKVNANLLQKKLKFLIKKLKINPKNILIDKDPNNVYDLPIMLLFEKLNNELKEKKILTGYNIDI